jgi:hypothetical protein
LPDALRTIAPALSEPAVANEMKFSPKDNAGFEATDAAGREGEMVADETSGQPLPQEEKLSRRGRDLR